MNKKSIILGLTLALVGCLPMGASFAAGTPHFKNNKAVAEYFWNEVFNKHDTAVIDTMVGPKYKQHSPEFADGKQAFKDGVSGFLKAYPDSTAVKAHRRRWRPGLHPQPHQAQQRRPRSGSCRHLPHQRRENRRTLGRHPGYPGKSGQRQYHVLDFSKGAIA